jgi:hypothetical protein
MAEHLKKIAIRIAVRMALIVLLFLALDLNPLPGRAGVILWDVLCTVTFAVCVVHWTGRAWFFVLATVFAMCVLLPVIVLGFIGESVYGSWSASVAKVIANARADGLLGAFQWFGSMVLATVAAWTYGRFKPMRVRPAEETSV